MNAPIPHPALRRSRHHVAVIGAGPGGLAAAMLLAARGAQVTLFERDGVVGGRTRTLVAPGGYRFDLGPTFFLYPRILSEIFAECGHDLETEVEMKRLDPLYRLLFEDGGVQVDVTHDLTRMQAEISKLDPADAAGIAPFLTENRAKLAAFKPVLERPFNSKADLLAKDMIKALPLMRPHRKVDADLRRYFRDPRVRLAFSFQTKYLGMSPFKCPSLFTILSFLEHEYGVFHPVGGCGAVSGAMARVAERMGVEIRLGAPVDRVAVEGGRAVGVEVGGQRHAADAVVINGDFAHAIPRLLPDAVRSKWTDAKIDRARYSCSTFMLYLGLEGTFPEIAHHTVVLSKAYQRNIHEIENGVLPAQPSFYMQNPTATDPSMAPPGHTALYLLVPVPNLRGGQDWPELLPRYRDIAIQRLKDAGLPEDLESRIRYEKVVTPQNWADDYAIGYGATFNLTHDLMQMLCFRPGNRFAEVPGVYLVGGGTHPGSGLPVIYEGARISTRLLAEDLGLDAAMSRAARAIAAD
jgi:phytoene desaturase